MLASHRFGDGLLVAQVPSACSGCCAGAASLRYVCLRWETREAICGLLLRRSLPRRVGLEILLEEVLLRLLLRLDLALHVLRQPVGDPAAADFRNLVLWVRATNLVRPLHLLGLDDHAADLRLAILCWSE